MISLKKIVNKFLSGKRMKINNGFYVERYIQGEDFMLDGLKVILNVQDDLLNPHVSLNNEQNLNKRIDELLAETSFIKE